jgi:peptidoglycan/LPS O-acetylase OafA/YrhL
MSQTNTTLTTADSGPLVQPGSTRRLDYIDGMRAAACLAVFAHHCWMFSGQPEWRIPLPHGHSVNLLRLCQFGNTGVHLFLLLSGYCLFRSFARPGGMDRFKVGGFARQRAWRILPGYYAACLLFLFLPVLLRPVSGWTVNGFHFAPQPGPVSVLLHILLLHGFYAPALYDLNGAFWSLSLEWQFYFTFPLLAWAFHRQGPWLTLAVVGGVNLLYRYAVARWLLSGDSTANWTWCSIFAGRWLEFGLGMLAAWQAARQPAGKMPGREVIALGAVALGCALAGGAAVAFSPLSDIFWGLAYYCLLRVTLRTGTTAQRLFALRPLVWIGTISYSIYLLHMPLLGVIWDVMPHSGKGQVNITVLATLGLLLVLPLSAFNYRVFERPFLGRGRTPRGAPELAVVGANPS